MSNSTERTEILKLIESGKISTSEGLKLLGSLDKTPPRPAADLRGRWLRIRVTNLTTQTPKVNVNLPLGLVSAGLHIGQRYAPELNGLDWDGLLDEIQRGVNGKLVDVEDLDGNEHVEIFVD